MTENQNPAWEVYIIETESGKLYTGIARNADQRFVEHLCDPKKGAKFFRSDLPLEIRYREPSNNRSEASKREAAIKKLSRKEKLRLIERG
jgi:putative endonuclease